ncbi:MAG: DUF6452 family protein [Capnocytophaga felis]|nr:DUF6452 family protein [Capnocytophaga felis]
MRVFERFILPIIVLVLMLMIFGACESDDLCDRPVNTPRLVVRFHDANDVSSAKPVNNMIVYGKDSNLILTNATTDSIVLPLKIETLSTTFVMVSDAVYDTASSTITSGNVATVTFTYGVEEEFVSKACGFRVVYNTLKASVENSNDSWIKSVNVKNTNVKNESSAQIHLYH